MRRQIRLFAVAPVVDAGGSIDPGTSEYPWANTPSKNLAEVWNNPIDPPDSTYGYAYCWPTVSPTGISVSVEKAPTLARILKLTLQAGFDYASQGARTWWFPPDNAHGPGAKLLLRSRDGESYHQGTGAAAYQFLDSDDNYVNTNLEPGVLKLHTLTWEMLAHPEGGPFTLEDINGLVPGVAFDFSLGPNGQAVEIVRFPKIRVPYLAVLLDIEDLGGDVEGVRHGASLTLRQMRRARNEVLPMTQADRTPAALGGRVYFSHPKGPGVVGGWGSVLARRRLERRPGLVLKRTINMEAFEIEDAAWDLADYLCLGWAAYRIDGPWSPDLQGLALLDKGKGFQHERAQDAWSPRPGDGALMRVLEDYPALSSEGLAVAGAGDVAIALQNHDLTLAGWSTVGSSGDFGVSQDTTVSLVEEQGYQTSAKLEYGAGGGRGGRERSLGTLPRAAGDRIHVRVVVRNTSVPDPETQFAEAYLVRSGGSLPAPEYWDEDARDWTTVATHLPIPSDEPFGEIVLDAIPCDAPLAATDPTYTIGVGRFSSNMGPATLHAALVDVQHTDDTVAGARPPLVTLADTITREADAHRMPHVYGRELWVHERGVAMVEVRPWWRAADLPADVVKPLLHAQHDADTYDALQFVARDGSDDVIRFVRAIAYEDDFELECPIQGLDLTRVHVLRAWCRWLGADGWTEYGPYSVEVGYAVFLAADGSLVQEASVVGRLASETPVPYARQHLAIGCDETRQLEGWVRTWEIRRNPLHRLDVVWRL